MSNPNTISRAEFDALDQLEQDFKMANGVEIIEPTEPEATADLFTELPPKPLATDFSNFTDFMQATVDWLLHENQQKVLVTPTYTLGKSTFELPPVRLNKEFELMSKFKDKSTGAERTIFKHEAIKMCLLILKHGVDAVNKKASCEVVFSNEYDNVGGMENYEAEF